MILLWLSGFKLSTPVASLLDVTGEHPIVVLVRNVGFLALAGSLGDITLFFFLTYFCSLNDRPPPPVSYSVFLPHFPLSTAQFSFLPAFENIQAESLTWIHGFPDGSWREFRSLMNLNGKNTTSLFSLTFYWNLAFLSVINVGNRPLVLVVSVTSPIEVHFISVWMWISQNIAYACFLFKIIVIIRFTVRS